MTDEDAAYHLSSLLEWVTESSATETQLAERLCAHLPEFPADPRNISLAMGRLKQIPLTKAQKPLLIHDAEFCGLDAQKDDDKATLEFDLRREGRRAIVLTQAQLHSLYQHILSEGAAGHLAFELR